MAAFDSWWLDIKLGLRMLGKHPGLALAGGVGIAVAVALAAGGYSIVDRNFSASALPLPGAEQLVALELWDHRANRAEPRLAFDLQRWRGGLRSVQELSAFQSLTPNLIRPGAAPESVRVAAISASGLGVARVAPLLGRLLTAADERRGAAPVVLISEGEWRRRFAAEAGILGRTLQLGGTHYAVAGVMPAGFAFPVKHDYWLPLRDTVMTASQPLEGPPLVVFGRLAPGATRAQAQAELTGVTQRTAQAYPREYAALRAQVAPYALPLLNIHGDDDFSGLIAMQGLVVSLLVLVCLNVAILIYTRTAMRQAEISVRTALGASRGRIIAQLFFEALVLSTVAAAVGVALAAVALGRIQAAVEQAAVDLPFWIAFVLTPAGMAYAAVLAVLAAVICGVVPGWQATRQWRQTGLRVVGSGESTLRLGRIWTVLIVAQVMFAVTLLPASVLSAWDGLRQGLAGPGFAAEKFLTAQFSAPPGAPLSPAPAELLRRLAAEPRLDAVTFAQADPGDEPGARAEVEGAGGEPHDVRVNRVGLTYFATFAVPLRAGRWLGEGDVTGPGILVNQSLAQRLFDGHALGRRLRYGPGADGESATAPWREIVGIVADFPAGVSAGMRDSPLKVYQAARPGDLQPVVMMVRVRDGAAAYAQRWRELAATVDPDLQLRHLRTLDSALRKEQWIRQLEASVFLAVTLSVVLLSAAGIYALMSFTVSQRRREIGIRMALGATRRGILTAVFSRALWQLGGGALAGAALAYAIITSTRVDVTARAASGVIAVVILFALATGLLAAWLPARRGTRIQASEALRH